MCSCVSAQLEKKKKKVHNQKNPKPVQTNWEEVNLNNGLDTAHSA